MQFDFGQNWINFSKRALTVDKLNSARRDFCRLFEGIDLTQKTFLDIGFGQGISILLAKEAGAIVFGNDINPKCKVASEHTANLMNISQDFPIIIGSILDNTTLKIIADANLPDGKFDIVHSWGVLHHTGDMKLAIRNATSLVAENGYFVTAIYNRHWSSKNWRLIKKTYCVSPSLIKVLIICVLYPVICLAKFVVTGKTPFKQERGMDFFYNVVDWVGGYPYEYASIDELVSFLNTLGFSCIYKNRATVPTGCNEFIFKRNMVT
jgi:2-polyprenyl-6-hydroxyphenyl methylase/3-demethylubiquinone-9 3-methyltransferase